MSTPLLKLDKVSAYYGLTQAIFDVSLSVPKGAFAALLGSNGAGKSTTLRAISGLIKVKGEIQFEGSRIDGVEPEVIVLRGISHMPEGRGVFTQLTVEENLNIPKYIRRKDPKTQKRVDQVYDLFPPLVRRRKVHAGLLSGGEQQMLAIGIGLILQPKLLMLDEPSLGLAPLITDEIFKILTAINKSEGLTILFSEQNVSLAQKYANQIFVMEVGYLKVAGSSEIIQQLDIVRKSYLGT